jgi:hypothetical protein
LLQKLFSEANMRQKSFGGQAQPGTAGGVHGIPPDPLAGFRGREGEEKERDRRELGEIREGVEGEEGRKGKEREGRGRVNQNRPHSSKAKYATELLWSIYVFDRLWTSLLFHKNFHLRLLR